MTTRHRLWSPGTVLIGVLLAAVGAPIGRAQSTPTWALVWSDEFNGGAIDRANWTFDLGGGGWGNRELQYYTDRPQNARVEDGCLVIEAREERIKNRNYSSARLKTQGLHGWTYGRIEARIQIPRGQGIWPAFWMLGEDIATVGWPGCGEIDIMENIGREPTTVHGTVHGPGYSGADGVGGAFGSIDGSPFADAFHTYAVEWGQDRIDWFVDGVHYLTVTPADVAPDPWVFQHGFFLILNVAVGGNWPGLPDSTTVFPQKMRVDYVRVYQDGSQPPPPPGATIHVGDLVMGTNATGPSWQATARVLVVDEGGLPVAGATVTGTWSGLVDGGNTSFVTDASGWAGPFYSHKSRASGSIQFCVGGVTSSGLAYDPGANAETCDVSSR